LRVGGGEGRIQVNRHTADFTMTTC